MNGENLYAEAFGMRERPFTLLPDPGFLYWSAQHKAAYSVLEFGVLSKAPITLITGEIGSGKTTLLQKLLQNLDENLSVGLVSNAQGGRGELIQWVLNSFGIDFGSETAYVPMFQKLQEFIIEKYADGGRVIIIVDEAQNLSREGLEELRMLTNVNSNKDELLQLILVGQPELKDMILDVNMKQIAQRVTASYHLSGMDNRSVAAYIRHRLQVAGGKGDEFTKMACYAIFDATKGVPRLVNQLCEFCMLYAWGNEDTSITVRTVRAVLADGVFFGNKVMIAEQQ